MKLSQKHSDPYTRVLIFGLPGSGKSTLAAKLAATHKLLWITLDNDTDILKKLSPEAQDNVELLDLPDSASFPVAAPTLLTLFRAKKGRVCFNHGVVECGVCKKSAPTEFTSIDFTAHTSETITVVDTATQLGRSILAHATKDKPVDYKPERDDWGALRKWTEFFASEFQAFRGNLIVIAHAIEADLEDGRTKLVPDFGSKGMSASFAKSFSHVIYTEVVNKKHRAYSSSTYANNLVLKSRTDFAIETLSEPSLESLFPIRVYLATPNQVVLDAQEAQKVETPAAAPSPAQHATQDLKSRLAAYAKK